MRSRIRFIILLVIVGAFAFMSTGCATTRAVATDKTPAAANGIIVVPAESGMDIDKLRVVAQEDLDRNIKILSKSKPGTYVAKVQFWNRAFWAVLGSFAMYGTICYFTGNGCDEAIVYAGAYGIAIIAMAIGDWDTDKARYSYNELWYSMVTDGYKHGYKAYPSETVPAGTVQVMLVKPPKAVDYQYIPAPPK